MASNNDGWEDVPLDNEDGWEDVELPGVGETALEGFGQGLTFGNLPQLQAAAEPALEKIYEAVSGSDLEDDGKGYVERRDENIKRMAAQKAANPKTAMASGLAGSLVSGLAIPMGSASTAGGRIAAGAGMGGLMGAISNPGDVEGVVDPLQLEKRGANAVLGAGIGAAVPAAIEGVKWGVNQVPKAASALKSLAEKWAVNATGATGKQAANFDDNAGRELLDRGIVKFGNSQEQIAKKAGAAVQQANDDISRALSELEQGGAKVDANKIYSTIRAKIDDIASDPSQADIARQLEGELDNLLKSIEARGGDTNIGINAAEQIKRGYNRKAGNWMDPEKGMVGKEMYQTFRKEVEDTAAKANPELSSLFEKGKKSFGLLRPIEEAAERRAATTSQSPPGGLLDMASSVAGQAAGDPSGVLLPIARRLAGPRISSSVAVGADKAADFLRRVPTFANLELKNPAAFQAMVNNLVNRPQNQMGNDKNLMPVEDAQKQFLEGN
jgi:hypothetical protein